MPSSTDDEKTEWDELTPRHWPDAPSVPALDITLLDIQPPARDELSARSSSGFTESTSDSDCDNARLLDVETAVPASTQAASAKTPNGLSGNSHPVDNEFRPAAQSKQDPPVFNQPQPATWGFSTYDWSPPTSARSSASLTSLPLYSDWAAPTKPVGGIWHSGYSETFSNRFPSVPTFFSQLPPLLPSLSYVTAPIWSAAQHACSWFSNYVAPSMPWANSFTHWPKHVASGAWGTTSTTSSISQPRASVLAFPPVPMMQPYPTPRAPSSAASSSWSCGAYSTVKNFLGRYW